MAIANIHETLLMYTKQKAMINQKLSDVMFNMLGASRQNAENQEKYNSQLQNAYYQYYESDPCQYDMIVETLEQDHELDLANLNSWEMQLELEKNNMETKLNEITSFESSWTKLLQTNIKNDFTYGGAQQ